MVLRLRPLVLVPLFVSSVCIVLLLRMSMEDARYLVPTLFVVVVTLLPAVLARRRIRRVLESGDVHGVLRAWQPTMDRVPHPETMAPLMIATAYASHGWLDAARTALAHAVKGPTWEAAREQRLFIEALLCTFEGEQQAATEMCIRDSQRGARVLAQGPKDDGADPRRPAEQARRPRRAPGRRSHRDHRADVHRRNVCGPLI